MLPRSCYGSTIKKVEFRNYLIKCFYLFREKRENNLPLNVMALNILIVDFGFRKKMVLYFYSKLDLLLINKDKESSLTIDKGL